jgi:hypothetical protein
MAVTQQTVVTCDHADCPQTIAREVASAPTDAAWLDNSGWVQFKAKPARGVGDESGVLPDPLRRPDGCSSATMSAADGLVLTQGKAALMAAL